MRAIIKYANVELMTCHIQGGARKFDVFIQFNYKSVAARVLDFGMRNSQGITVTLLANLIVYVFLGQFLRRSEKQKMHAKMTCNLKASKLTKPYSVDSLSFLVSYTDEKN